jgi:hypothetical protein
MVADVLERVACICLPIALCVRPWAIWTRLEESAVRTGLPPF